MTQQSAEDRAADHQKIVAASFPEIGCLRCGFHDFYIMPNVEGASGLGAITLACKKCGHIEQHLIGVLREAMKNGTTPIVLEK